MTETLFDTLHRIVADGSCEVLSLDVFDTVLWRKVPRPSDLFALLGARLRAEGFYPEWVTDATFRRMRMAAEREAREGRGEVSLLDIWAAMPDLGGAPPERLAEAEVRLEREMTVVDLDMAEVVKAARKHEVPVVLVSDTYFTKDQLGHLLDRPELGGALGDARIFRSQRHGTGKADGLWEIVLRDLGLSPEQVVHVGDNESADVEVPGRLGVRTLHYRRLDDAYLDYLGREREPAGEGGDQAPGLHPEHGDFGLTSLRAKAMEDGTGALAIARRFGAGVLGPVLTGFAEWVVQRAHDEGTRVVWCPMREGELLAELVNEAARARGRDVVAKPVWLSRHVTSLAGLNGFDADDVHRFVRGGYQLTVRQALAVLDLQPGEVPALAAELDTVIDNGDIAERVGLALTETPHLRNRLNIAVTAARDRLMRSLRAAGALDGPGPTLVDLGWGGTIQRQLAKALRLAGLEARPAGLYLVTNTRIEAACLDGLRAEGYLAQAGHPAEVAETLSRSPEVVEQGVNALCGSLVGFTESGEPVLAETAPAPAQDAERRAVQEGIRSFQGLWNRYVTGAEGGLPDLAGPREARDRLARILVAALKTPTADEAAVFGTWAHEDNFGSALVTRLLPDDVLRAVPYLSPPDLDDLEMRDTFWPGLVAASDTRLAALAGAGLDGEVFEPAGDEQEARLRFMTADGEWHDGSRQRIRVNHNGLSYARLRFEHHDTSEVSLAIPGRPALVRVDWIEARVIAGGRRVEQVLRWDRPEDFANLYYADCRWLGGNLMEFDKPYAAVWLPLAKRAGTDVVSSGQVSIAFAMLPQSMTGLAGHAPVPKAAVRAAERGRLAERIRSEYRSRGVGGVAAGMGRVALRRLGGTR